MRTLQVLLVVVVLAESIESFGYLGKFLGSLDTLEHGVRGDIYAVDSRTLHLGNFNYDGRGPDAFFYAGSGKTPSGRGFIIADENGSLEPLGSYRNKNITLTLPNSKSLDDVQWISVWCRAFAVDFGNLIMSSAVSDYPRPQKIGRLKTLDHGVSSGDIVVVDAQTLLIPQFSYDGSAPDAHFWVGRGARPSPSGIIVPDENGRTTPLRDYSRKTIVITLPGQLTVHDIDHLSIWCEDFYVDFGHVLFDPTRLDVPPSLKMLGVKPQSKLNCERLDNDLPFEVRWAVAGESIVMQFVSRIEQGNYMAFGLSGDSDRTKMNGGDVIAAWLDRRSGQGYAVDYHLRSKAQCTGDQGSCPDEKLKDGDNQVRLLNSAMINGFSMLTMQRPLEAYDEWDSPIYVNRSQAVIWALGPLNSKSEVSYHNKRIRGDLLIDFGRIPEWNCPQTEHQTLSASSPSLTKRPDSSGSRRRTSSSSSLSSSTAPTGWTIPAIPCHEPADGVFYAQIGPSGGQQGYTSITGRVGWGIAWYINGLLVPEVNVVRGRTYTFVVEGGRNVNNPAKQHPFYITDDPEGGYKHKSAEQRSDVRVFAGVSFDETGAPGPSATGRLCEWTTRDATDTRTADEYASFGAFQRSLTLQCEAGQPAVVQWTPDDNTPDTVYYQCYTHRHLGWKINVVDSCATDESVRARSSSSSDTQERSKSKSRRRGHRARG